MASKPEQATLPERLIMILPIPYILGSLIIGLLLLVLIPTFVELYSETNSLSAALNTTFSPQGILNSVYIPYLFYAPHFMRMRLLKSEPKLSQLLPQGEEEFHRLFGRVSAVRPQLVMWAFFSIILFIQFNFVSLFISPPSTPPTILEMSLLASMASTISSLTIFFASTWTLSNLAWVYYSMLKGIHTMGGTVLNFSHYYTDPFLGLKPVGNLALSLAAAYFGFEGLLILSGVASSPTTEDLITVGGLLLGLVVVGVLAFFLPLRRLHLAMAQQKALEREKLSESMASIIETSQSEQSIPKILAVDLTDRKVSQISTWPFDFQILGKMTIITLSVTAALLTRVIISFLHI